MADLSNLGLADRLVELAVALTDQRLPLQGRADFVKRELADLARELLDAPAARGVTSMVGVGTDQIEQPTATLGASHLYGVRGTSGGEQ